MSRPWLAVLTIVSSLAAAAPAEALQTRTYSAGAAKCVIAAGREVIIHIYAPWCLEFRAQASILSGISSPGVTVFRVGHGGWARVCLLTRGEFNLDQVCLGPHRLEA